MCEHLKAAEAGIQELTAKLQDLKFRNSFLQGRAKCQECRSNIETLWVCLEPGCGYRGCGRYEQRHSLGHFRSAQHPVCINLRTGMCWCYECDEQPELAGGDVASLDVLRSTLFDTAQPSEIESEDSGTDSELRGGADSGEGRSDIRNALLAAPILRVAKKPCGLTNLGNTCYANACLQALAHCKPFAFFFLSYPLGTIPHLLRLRGASGGSCEKVTAMDDIRVERESVELVPGVSTHPDFEIPKTSQSRLVQAVQEFIHNAHGRQTVSGWEYSVVPPPFSAAQLALNGTPASKAGLPRSQSVQGLLSGIRELHPGFRGFQQQDSQEFLRALLMYVHEGLAIRLPQYEEDQDSAEMDDSQGSDNSVSAKKRRTKSGVSPRGDRRSSRPVPRRSSRRQAIRASLLKDDADGSGSEQSSLQTQSSDGGSGAVGTRSAATKSEGLFSVGGDRRTRYTEPLLSPSRQRGRARLHPMRLPRRSATSVVYDTFQGLYASDVCCSSCWDVSRTVETFMDLSLSIPSVSQLKDLRENVRTLRNQHAADHGEMADVQSPQKLEEESCIRIEDCLSLFFSPETLMGVNRYNCEHCKSLQNAVKSLKLVEVPEVLCLHIKRFRHDRSWGTKISDYVQFPLTGLDLSPFCSSSVIRDGRAKGVETARYDLFAVVNQHGSLHGGHYTSYVRRYDSGTGGQHEWFLCNDSHVTPVEAHEVQQSEAYILFYQRSRTADNRCPELDTWLQQQWAHQGNTAVTARRNRHEALDVSCSLSQYWLTKYISCSVPGPVDVSEWHCVHGQRDWPLLDGVDPFLLRSTVPPHVVEAVHKRYGANYPLSKMASSQRCEECPKERRDLHRRRQRELAEVQALDKEAVSAGKGDRWYMIDSNWLGSWKNFVSTATGDPPGPISNDRLMSSESGRVRKGLKRVRDYRGVNRSVWSVLLKNYGGGPAISRRSLDIYDIDSDSESSSE